ncbi:hypothetical protein RvY_12139-2 [Ramazzottius varieornatus]|uniref:Uncharacterized protein n=1 Tax=Ramazzottius varieornatus TaxID=947166 RepID=A0A1D1VKU6_RAMVA|nr:hypothetical protein RvY_12139-2 [Ramazzottius varieornatus]
MSATHVLLSAWSVAFITLLSLDGTATESRSQFSRLNITVGIYGISEPYILSSLPYVLPGFLGGLDYIGPRYNFQISATVLSGRHTVMVRDCIELAQYLYLVPQFYYSRPRDGSLFLLLHTGCNEIYDLSAMSLEWNTLVLSRTEHLRPEFPAETVPQPDIVVCGRLHADDHSAARTAKILLVVNNSDCKGQRYALLFSRGRNDVAQRERKRQTDHYGLQSAQHYEHERRTALNRNQEPCKKIGNQIMPDAYSYPSANECRNSSRLPEQSTQRFYDKRRIRKYPNYLMPQVHQRHLFDPSPD